MAVYFGSNKVKPSGIKTVYFGNNKVYETGGPTPTTETYVFNSTVTITTVASGTYDGLNFTVNGVTYNKIRLTAGTSPRVRIYESAHYQDVYTNGAWADDAYKTWVINNFSSWPAALATWVITNATKQ